MTQSSPSPSNQDISKLDKNFAVGSVEAGQRWVDLRELTLEGQGWRDESAPFTRYPDRAKPTLREPVWHLSRHSAGIRVRFRTNAPSISARWSLLNENLAMPHMPATGVSGVDLYALDPKNKWRWAAIGIPKAVDNEVPLFKDGQPITRDYTLYLPLYNGVTSAFIGVPEQSTITPLPRTTTHKPICFFGTSILHGGCASRPGMGYPEIISRRLDRPHLNLGFSGNAKLEPAASALLAELDPCLYLLDALPNNTVEEAAANLEPFVRTIRAARPNTPIVLVENIEYQDGWHRKERQSKTQGINEINRAVYEKLLAEGWKNLHYIASTHLLGDDGEGTVDGAHPTDLGFFRMAAAIEPTIRALV
jgi:hypothetical protein